MYCVMESLRRARLERGLSRKQVADSIGYSEHTIKAWENGVVPNVLAMAAYAEFLGINIDQLIGKEKADGDQRHGL